MKFRKPICLLLILAAVLSTAACTVSQPDNSTEPSGNETVMPTETIPEEIPEEDILEPVAVEPEQIQGSWVANIYITEKNTGLEGFETDAGLPVLLTFNENGTAYITAYEEGLEESYALLKTALCEYMVQMMYAQFEESGYTREEVDEQFLAIHEMTPTEYAEAYVDEMDLCDYFLRLDEEVSYEVRDGVLIVDDAELSVAFREETLVILDSEKPKYWNRLGMEFPLELERVESTEES